MKKCNNNASLFYTLRLITKYEPSYLFLSGFKIITGSAASWFLVWFPKRFIEMLLDSEKNYAEISIEVLNFVAIMLCLWVVSIVLNENETRVTERFSQSIRREIGLVSMKNPLWVLETGNYKEQLNRANNVSGILNVIGISERIIEKGITSAGLAVLLLGYDWKIFILIFAVLALKVFFVKITVNYSNKRYMLYGKNDRVGNYLTYMSYMNPGAAKEVRINNSQNWFLNKVWAYRNEMLSLQYQDFNKYALFDVLSGVIMAVQTLVVVISLAYRTTTGIISIPDFTMYFNAITQITLALSGIIGDMGEYNRFKICLGDFSKLLASEKNDKNKDEVLKKEFNEIRFDRVSFKYPGTDKEVLKDVSFSIKRNEKLSIVGLNGAGKSTLIKLLCKFYRPCEGHIYLDQRDIWDINNESYYKMLSAVFQDYINFAFSVKENVEINNSDVDIKEVAHRFGFDDSIEELSDGWDTIISRLFDDSGIDLSGGEQQRVAILRALCKDAPIVVLDEPTGALDARAEAEMYQNFIKLMKDRTAILISHRLASAVIAEKILLLYEGQIKEYGTHEELMRKKGLYFDMYNKQSEAYLNN